MITMTDERKRRPAKKEKPPILLRMATRVFIVFVATLWFYHERINISQANMYIYSGIALIVLIFSIVNRKKMGDVEVSDKHLEKNRERLGADSYSGDSFK